VLRDHWNCFKLNNVFSPKFVNGTVDVEENQFFPKIEFYGLDEKPLKYPTRDICPVQDPIIAAELDRRLDVLIQGLVVCNLKIFLFYCSCMQSKN
jgi:hypothetical protein